MLGTLCALVMGAGLGGPFARVAQAVQHVYALPQSYAPAQAYAPAQGYAPAQAYAPAQGTQHQTPSPLDGEPDARVTLAPGRVIAPVGSEVILIAGVCRGDGFYAVGERIQWILNPGSVGYFVSQDQGTSLDWLMGLGQPTWKVDNMLAVGLTSRRNTLLTRGTPTPADDTSVLRGQTWISVSSPVEGVSHVTAFAPSTHGWDRNKKTATIHWIDAQWTFPQPAINPVGTGHVFTSRVSRLTNGAPIEGWLVRYQWTGGASAGFAPDGAASVEVPTDAQGLASVEVFQPQPAAGTSEILVSVVRPAQANDPPGSELILGSGTTTKTWTAPDIALRKSGPSQASVGATLTYVIEVSNPGGLATTDVVVTDQIAPPLSYLASRPEGQINGGVLSWDVGELGPHESRRFEVDLRADAAGEASNCAQVTAAQGISAQDCAITRVDAPSVDVQVQAPTQASIGDSVTFDITVVNRGTVAATGLVAVARLDEGMIHSSGANPIEHDLQDLEPGQATRMPITVQVQRAGHYCLLIDVQGDANLRGSDRACLEVAEAPRPGLSVRKTSPDRRMLGATVDFTILVTNTGTAPLTDLVIRDHYDPQLEPTEATRGFVQEGGDLDLVWRVPSLQPGQVEKRTVRCRCIAGSARTCNQVRVSCREGLQAEDEACLEIISEQPQLGLTVADRRDPIQLGNEQIYEIQITNHGDTPARSVQVVATLGVQSTALPPLVSDPVKYTIQGGTIRYNLIQEVRPGQTINLQLRARAAAAGASQVRVELTAQGLPQALSAEETTQIFAGP